MKLFIVVLVIVLLGGAIVFILMRNTDSESSTKVVTEDEVGAAALTYQDISPADLDNIISSQEDVFLLDVHIPEQQHITGTDSFVPYNELEQNIN